MVFHAMHSNGFLRGGSANGPSVGEFNSNHFESSSMSSSPDIKINNISNNCNYNSETMVSNYNHSKNCPLQESLLKQKRDKLSSIMVIENHDSVDHDRNRDMSTNSGQTTVNLNCWKSNGHASGIKDISGKSESNGNRATSDHDKPSGSCKILDNVLSNDNDEHDGPDDDDDDDDDDDNDDDDDYDESQVLRINLPSAMPSRAEPKFPKEKYKTLVAFGLALFSAMFNTLTLAIVHERLPDPKTVQPLPDLVFDMFLKRDWALDLSEALLIASLVTMFLVSLLHKHRFIVLRRAFLIFSILYLMRGLSMLVTQVPASSSSIYCAPKANCTSPSVLLKRVFELTSGLGMSMNGHQNYCGDYIYSGHTVTLTLCYLIVQEYTPRRCLFLHWISWTTSFTAAVLLLVAHAHYTIDILLAYYVTTRVFYIYHTMANNIDLKNPSSTNYLARVWWFYIFDYFEQNVKDRVPMQYDWPLVSPKPLMWPTRRYPKGDRNS